MAEFVYVLCAATSFFCFVMLWRRRRNAPLLYWSALCFGGLTFHNLLLVLDKFLTPLAETMSTARLVAGLIAVLLLLFGLVWHED